MHKIFSKSSFDFMCSKTRPPNKRSDDGKLMRPDLLDVSQNCRMEDLQQKEFSVSKRGNSVPLL